MKRMIALALALLMLGSVALAEVPTLSDWMFTCAKQALLCMSSGEYERIVTGLPCAGTAPSAQEWERFAANFHDLDDAQTRYAVAYWRGNAWAVAVPVDVPSNPGVETLVLTSGDGASFNGYRYCSWGQVQKECQGSDYVRWNEEYVGGDAMVLPDSAK